MATLLSSSKGSTAKAGESVVSGDASSKRVVSSETTSSDNQDIIGLPDIYTIVFVISTFPVELAQVCKIVFTCQPI